MIGRSSPSKAVCNSSACSASMRPLRAKSTQSEFADLTIFSINSFPGRWFQCASQVGDCSRKLSSLLEPFHRARRVPRTPPRKPLSRAGNRGTTTRRTQSESRVFAKSRKIANPRQSGLGSIGCQIKRKPRARPRECRLHKGPVLFSRQNQLTNLGANLRVPLPYVPARVSMRLAGSWRR